MKTVVAFETLTKLKQTKKKKEKTLFTFYRRSNKSYC